MSFTTSWEIKKHPKSFDTYTRHCKRCGELYKTICKGSRFCKKCYKPGWFKRFAVSNCEIEKLGDKKK